MKSESSPQSSKLLTSQLSPFSLTKNLLLFYYQLGTQTSSHTRSRSWRTAQALYASLWSTPTVVTCFRKSPSRALASNPRSPSRPAGPTSSRCSVDCRPSMTVQSCTGISNVQTSSWRNKVCSNLAISTSARSPNKDSYQRKQALPIMQVLKYGKTSPMTTRVTYGVWAASHMRCALCSHHSVQMTWISSSSVWPRGAFHPCPPTSPKTWCSVSNCACSSSPLWGPIVTRCFKKVN